MGLRKNKNLFRAAAYLAAAVCIFAMWGCRPAVDSTGAASSAVESPQRIICGSPAIGELVFALGCADRVVGVSAHSDFPPEILEKPVFGSSLAPNREVLMALQPDLILSQGRAESLTEFARAMDIPMLSVSMDTMADVRQAIVDISRALEGEEQGGVLLEQMNATLPHEIPRATQTVFLALGHTPGDFASLFTTGGGTYLDEWLQLAGGANAYGDLRQPWPVISLESLVKRAPAIVLDIQYEPPTQQQKTALLDDWAHLGIEPSRVRFVSDTILLRPGIRAARAIQLLHTAIHSPAE